MKNETIRPKQAKHKKYMLVRYGRMSQLGFFEHKQTKIPHTPTRLVIKTDKGLELGRIVGCLGCYKYGQFKLNEKQVKQYFDNSNIPFDEKPAGSVIRYATAEDLSEETHLKKIAEEEIKYCKMLVKEMDLPMKIIDADHIFGGERIIFYFMSETRVDFRELVKKLAREYQSRIEMRQIGSRDEAKLLGDLESCGQQCCCKRFLKALKPVNMRMAKMQKATLDPSKISGYCGRLKCCLRYEDKTYSELKKRLPRRSSIVQTAAGKGRIIDMQILTQMIIVELETGTRNAFPLDEIEILAPPEQQNRKRTRGEDQNNNNNNRSNNRNNNNNSKNAGVKETKNSNPGEAPKANVDNKKAGEDQNNNNNNNNSKKSDVEKQAANTAEAPKPKDDNEQNGDENIKTID
jgi:cell fate regulator YaaT (PSP1 superfamily)